MAISGISSFNYQTELMLNRLRWSNSSSKSTGSTTTSSSTDKTSSSSSTSTYSSTGAFLCQQLSDQLSERASWSGVCRCEAAGD